MLDQFDLLQLLLQVLLLILILYNFVLKRNNFGYGFVGCDLHLKVFYFLQLSEKTFFISIRLEPFLFLLLFIKELLPILGLT